MKVLIITTLFLAGISLATAQIPFGVKAGFNVNNISIKNQIPQSYEETSSSLSYHISVFTKIKLSEKLAIMPELQYITKGVKFTDSLVSSGTIKIGYIEMPLIVSYSIMEKLSIEAGPSFGLKVSSKEVKGGKTYTLNDNFAEKTDLGLTAGLRFNLDEKFSILGRYYYGISPMVKAYWTENGIDQEVTTAYNRNIQFSLAYRIF